MNDIYRYIPILSRAGISRRPILVLLVLVTLMLINITYPQGALADISTRRVNIPYLGASQDAVTAFTPSIFWMGKVDPWNNYADVRTYYYDDYLKIVVHVIYRLHWIDPTPTIEESENWDSVTLFFNIEGNQGTTPSAHTFRLVSQLGDFQASYTGQGNAWVPESIAFTANTSWRGDEGPNSNVDAKGWMSEIVIPFSSLGVSKPVTGTTWGFAVVLHDRDDLSGNAFFNTNWPETMDPNIPSTWAQLHFGIPEFNPGSQTISSQYIIQNGLNDSIVKDAHVGGHTICGDNVDHWTEWGTENYAGYSQFNIQNQWDISDWPCFSKYYITFPLDSIPSGQTIHSANLSMYLFGNAGGGEWGEPPNSYIVASTVSEDWDETSINWNNAPLAEENISGTWVYPNRDETWDLYTWNVSRAVQDAYDKGIPLRLALYSIDGERHSGKYFISSDWDEVHGHPYLTITTGTGCSPENPCHFLYLPLAIQ